MNDPTRREGSPAARLGDDARAVPLEDDAVITERGVEWLYPVADRILLIK